MRMSLAQLEWGVNQVKDMMKVIGEAWFITQLPSSISTIEDSTIAVLVDAQGLFTLIVFNWQDCLLIPNDKNLNNKYIKRYWELADHVDTVHKPLEVVYRQYQKIMNP